MCSKRLKDSVRAHTHTHINETLANAKPLIVPVHIKACLTQQAGLLDKLENKKMALMTSVDRRH